jgi:hypothetical protein
MAAAPPVFDAELLAEALGELGQIAQRSGRVIDLALYGGSCLMLVSNFRLATRDVDAVAAEDQGFLDQAARTVADRHGWPEQWLNDGVRTYLSPLVEDLEQHMLFRSYPSEDRPGVRVFVPTPEYMLAMKLMALRIGPEEDQKDLDDILNLLEIVRLDRKEDIVAFAARFYPEARVSAKLVLSINTLWSEHERRRALGHEPPRYLNRGGQSG